MAWWPRRKQGKHALPPSATRPTTQAFERVADDLRETIMRRQEVDKLVARVQREFGAR